MKKFKHKITGIVAEKLNTCEKYKLKISTSDIIPAWVIENSNDWEEIVEKDYEILEYKSIQGLHCEKGQYCFDVVSQYGNPNEWFIYKIRRKSDGVEFKIGDKVYNPNCKSQTFIIESFYLDCNNIHLLCGKGHINITKIEHYKEPILITEDGYEMFEGDKVYFVEIGEYLHKGCEIVNSYKYNYILDKDFKFFKTKENAEKYIYENKPEFSRKQILNAINSNIGFSVFGLGDLIIESDFKHTLKL